MSPDVQPVADGVGWCVGALTYGSVFRRRWSRNQRAALDLLLTQNLLPNIREYSDFYTFQQDGAPAHRAQEM